MVMDDTELPLNAMGPGGLDADHNEPESSPNIIDRITDKVDSVQRRIIPVAVIFAITKKFGEDRGGHMAVLLAYRGFFSIFPLMLAFISGLELLLSNNKELRDNLIDSALTTIPVVGSTIAEQADGLGGNWVVLITSVAVSIWAGLGLLEMLQEVFNLTWEVPRFERPPFIIRKLRAAGGALVLAIAMAISGAGRWILSDDFPGFWHQVIGALLPITAGMVAMAGLQKLMSERKVPFIGQLPGIIAMGLGWWGLQALGGFYLTRFVTQSSDRYGVFVVVLGLLSWSYLLGMLFMYANEFSAVLYLRRWPRSLTGRNLTRADMDAVRFMSGREVAVRGTEMTVDVPRNPL